MRKYPVWLKLLFRLSLAALLFFVCMHIGRYVSGANQKEYFETSEVVNLNKITEQEVSKKETKTEIDSSAKVAESKKEKEPLKEKEQEKDIDSTHILSQKNVHMAKKMNYLLENFKPAYAFYLMVDIETNEILAWGESKDRVIQQTPDFLSRSTFPAASLIKTVTLAAALESKQYALNTQIPLIGNAHTLYKRQLKPKENYSGPTVSLEDAYAKSQNPPMALVGYKVGARTLRKTAKNLGFNLNFPKGVPNLSEFSPPDTGYGLAEVASGFTNQTTLSPLLAAAQIRAILKEKPLQIPHGEGLAPYAPKKPLALPVSKFSKNTYYGLQMAMLRSVTHGTARKNISTKYMAKKNYNELHIGGKTGTVDGNSPEGRYEWFAGFAKFKNNPKNGIVLVVMQAHYNKENETRSQPATQVAAMLINYWAHWSRSQNEEK